MLFLAHAYAELCWASLHVAFVLKICQAAVPCQSYIHPLSSVMFLCIKREKWTFLKDFLVMWISWWHCLPSVSNFGLWVSWSYPLFPPLNQGKAGIYVERLLNLEKETLPKSPITTALVHYLKQGIWNLEGLGWKHSHCREAHTKTIDSVFTQRRQKGIICAWLSLPCSQIVETAICSPIKVQ